MTGFYGADMARQMVIVGALNSYGLDLDPFAAIRRPAPARTLAEQQRRVELGGKVLAEVRRVVPISRDDRLLIVRFVDAACERLEEAERPKTVSTTAGATDAAVIAYHAAGGGTCGSFESFVRSFVSSVPLLEPVVDRQDVEPAPMTTNPTRRPNGPKAPGTVAPEKSNPQRTVRSRRWTPAGKAVRT